MDIDDVSTSPGDASQSDLFLNSDFRETDDASRSIVDSGGSPMSKDYWFGKKYFRCVLAQELLRQTPAEESIQSIDSKLETTIQRFPYDETVNTLRAQGIITSQMRIFSHQSNHSEVLMMLIGSICRQGRSREKHALLTALRKNETDLGFVDRHVGGSPNLQGREHQPIPSLDGNEPMADIGFYTLILKEHGDRDGIIPSYNFETIALVPPCFKATLSFNGTLFVGQGSSKSKAKHSASRRACESLRLRLR